MNSESEILLRTTGKIQNTDVRASIVVEKCMFLTDTRKIRKAFLSICTCCITTTFAFSLPPSSLPFLPSKAVNNLDQ